MIWAIIDRLRKQNINFAKSANSCALCYIWKYFGSNCCICNYPKNLGGNSFPMKEKKFRCNQATSIFCATQSASKENMSLGTIIFWKKKNDLLIYLFVSSRLHLILLLSMNSLFWIRMFNSPYSEKLILLKESCFQTYFKINYKKIKLLVWSISKFFF